MSPLLRAALAYAAKGWKVFPVAPGGKAPLGGHGHKDATSDPDQIRRWWADKPDANIGLSLASSGLVAVDIDAYKSDCEWDEFAKDKIIPPTLEQSSARGGRHLIFTVEPGASFPQEACKGVDLKHNGYVLLAPSEFERGYYKWANDQMPAPVPDWVPRKSERAAVKAVTSPLEVASEAGSETAAKRAQQAIDGALEKLKGTTENRNDTLNKTAYWLGQRVAGGLISEEDAQRRLDEAAGAIGLLRDEPMKTAGTISRGLADGAKKPVSLADYEWASLTEGLSDDALALALANTDFGRNARYASRAGGWHLWNEQYWAEDHRSRAENLIPEFLRHRAHALMKWAEEKGDDAALKQAKVQRDRLRSKGKGEAVATFAKMDAAADIDDFDRDPFLLATTDGTIDLKTGEVREARREDLITKAATVAPAPAGTPAPQWSTFLREVFSGEDAVIEFIQRLAGYALTGSTVEHRAFYFHGTGRNGKSVLTEVLQAIWGEYATTTPAEMLMDSYGGQHPTALAALRGRRLVVSSEVPPGRRWNVTRLKDLTGGDRITARYMREDFFEFDPQLTLIVRGNDKPAFRGVDAAMRARFVLVPFEASFVGREDRGLKDRLLAEEGPAILRWAIDGAAKWWNDGRPDLMVPASIKAASDEYLDSEDVMGRFLEDCTKAEGGCFSPNSDLYPAFERWCEDEGIRPWASRSGAPRNSARRRYA